jgi:hypothetical protein
MIGLQAVGAKGYNGAPHNAQRPDVSLGEIQVLLEATHLESQRCLRVDVRRVDGAGDVRAK